MSALEIMRNALKFSTNNFKTPSAIVSLDISHKITIPAHVASLLVNVVGSIDICAKYDYDKDLNWIKACFEKCPPEPAPYKRGYFKLHYSGGRWCITLPMHIFKELCLKHEIIHMIHKAHKCFRFELEYIGNGCILLKPVFVCETHEHVQDG